MNIPHYIRRYPLIFRPSSKFFKANAIYPWIFVSKEIFTDLQLDKPNPKSIAALFHEEKHRKRQIEMGWWKFGLRYIFSRRFRFEEELEAYKITKKVYLENHMKFETEKIARALSGLPYLWARKYNDAFHELNRL